MNSYMSFSAEKGNLIDQAYYAFCEQIGANEDCFKRFERDAAKLLTLGSTKMLFHIMKLAYYNGCTEPSARLGSCR
ncbi:hypothetical protein H6P81_006261 [Aristolochia fimbriata]|uniref:Uncharacterized protein n=1 Tax=Aristolochia fimbriata TaxID=158543 RepID=A0AAV7F0C2_ARIFI|nr:hypothetical protein H6P81_006261 [Aristolochia fimbriata]